MSFLDPSGEKSYTRAQGAITLAANPREDSEKSVEQHVKVLGVLYIVLGCLGVMAALVTLVIFGGVAGIVGVAAHEEPGARIAVPILGAIGVGVFCFLLVVSLPGIIAGYGLLQFRPWARILTMVLSVLNLMNFPLGTAVGIYGLWVMLSGEAEPLFRGSLPPPSR